MSAFYDQSQFFKEQQNFKSTWLRVFLLAIPIGLTLLFAWGIFQQLILHRPWGDRPLPDVALIVVAILVTSFAYALPFFVLGAKMIVVVDREAVRISFAPFARRTLLLSQIARVEARAASPLREFGGVGVRWAPGGWAYMVSGTTGVQLELLDGKRAFIGSQRSDELAQAIEQAKFGT